MSEKTESFEALKKVKFDTWLTYIWLRRKEKRSYVILPLFEFKIKNFLI